MENSKKMIKLLKLVFSEIFYSLLFKPRTKKSRIILLGSAFSIISLFGYLTIGKNFDRRSLVTEAVGSDVDCQDCKEYAGNASLIEANEFKGKLYNATYSRKEVPCDLEAYAKLAETEPAVVIPKHCYSDDNSFKKPVADYTEFAKDPNRGKREFPITKGLVSQWVIPLSFPQGKNSKFVANATVMGKSCYSMTAIHIGGLVKSYESKSINSESYFNLPERKGVNGDRINNTNIRVTSKDNVISIPLTRDGDGVSIYRMKDEDENSQQYLKSFSGKSRTNNGYVPIGTALAIANQNRYPQISLDDADQETYAVPFKKYKQEAQNYLSCYGYSNTNTKIYEELFKRCNLPLTFTNGQKYSETDRACLIAEMDKGLSSQVSPMAGSSFINTTNKAYILKFDEDDYSKFKIKEDYFRNGSTVKTTCNANNGDSGGIVAANDNLIKYMMLSGSILEDSQRDKLASNFNVADGFNQFTFERSLMRNPNDEYQISLKLSQAFPKEKGGPEFIYILEHYDIFQWASKFTQDDIFSCTGRGKSRPPDINKCATLLKSFPDRSMTAINLQKTLKEFSGNLATVSMNPDLSFLKILCQKPCGDIQIGDYLNLYCSEL